MTRRAATLMAACALVALGVAAYSNSFNGPFIFDDVPAIVQNPAIHRGWPPGPVLAGPRPVVDLTFAVNYSLGRFNVTGYHLVNLAIHILAALTLFGIVRRTLTLRIFASRFSDDASIALAFCAALIWLVHPLQTEAVTYITQRMESLMGLFYLLTLYCFVRAATPDRTDRTDRTDRSYWTYVCVAACALGMGCKQVMVTAPVALLLYDRTFLAGSFREALRRRWGLYLALAGTWLIILPSAIAAFSPQEASAGLAVPGLTPLLYARSEPGVILHYLCLAFWPSGLCLDYGWPIARTAWRIAPGAIVLGALLAATVWAVIRRPAWGFLGAWFLLTLAPTSSFLPIRDLAAEHRMYLALAAPVIAVVLAAYLIGKRLLPGRPGAAGAPAIAVALAAALTLTGLTLSRNWQYRTEISIWEDATRKRPENPKAWSNLGDAYVKASLYDKAVTACNNALDRAPEFSLAYNNRGNAYAGLGRLTEALNDFDEAIRLDPDSATARVSRAIACEKAGRGDLALADYSLAIELNPRDAVAHNNRGIAYARAGRADESLRDYDEALKLNPDYAEAYNNRGNVLVQIGRVADALRDYDRAIALRTGFADAWYNRAIANSRLGRRDEALRDYARVLKLNPENAAAYNGRGKTLAAADRTAEAIRDFDRAIALNPRYADAYYNRGNARADAGRRAEAVQDYDQAIALEPDFAAAYNNRAVAYYEMKDYDKARADVKTFERLGGRPDPGFLKALEQAAGPAGRTAP